MPIGIPVLNRKAAIDRLALVITGSDLLIIQESRARLPGRRGPADQADFHLFPLSFREVVTLKGRLSPSQIGSITASDRELEADVIAGLFEEFDSYLSHGGFLTAINDLARTGCILPATFSTYSDWIRGDVLKRGRQERYLLEILGAIIKRYCGQVTWNALAGDLSIDHPKTVADYVAILESMDAVFVQPALLEDKLAPAPKKPRKLMFCDPFIFHAVRAWLHPSREPFEEQVKTALSDPEWSSRLAESVVATHYRRLFPTFFIKAEGEVDVAYVKGNRFWPMEIKWTGQLRPKQLKQIRKYPNSLILTRSRQSGVIMGVPSRPLPVELLGLGG